MWGLGLRIVDPASLDLKYPFGLGPSTGSEQACRNLSPRLDGLSANGSSRFVCRINNRWAQKRWRMDTVMLLTVFPGVAETPPKKPEAPSRSCEVFLFFSCVNTALRSVRLDSA